MTYPKPARRGWSFLGAALLLLAGGGWPALLAQTNPPGNRYLLVIDTGKSMQPRGVAVSNAVGEWFNRSMANQFRPGDTLGIWTFATRLSTGQFPLQHWVPGQERVLMERVLTFVNELTYDGEASLKSLHPALERLIQGSPFITIILVTDGAEPMRGTPFDTQINDLYKTWRERQLKTQLPFLTVLRARQGTITDFSVTPAPWPVEMPPLPPELQRAAAPHPETVTRSPAPVVAPLIFHGTDPKPSSVETAKAASASGHSGTAPQVHAALTPAAETMQSGTKGLAPPGTAGAARADTSNTPLLLAQSEPLHYHVSGAVPGAAPGPAPGAAAPAQGNSRAADPGPPAASAPTVHPAAETSAAASATALPPAGWATRKAFWLAALVLVSALAGLSLMLVRRARPSPHVSLITRSFERENK